VLLALRVQEERRAPEAQPALRVLLELPALRVPKASMPLLSSTWMCAV